MTEEISKKVDEFFSQYRVRKYAKGQVLLLYGDELTDVFYLLKGKVKEYDVSYRGDDLILNVFKHPAFFPMSLAINKGPSAYIYEAESEVELRQAPVNEVITFIKDNPDVLYDLLSRVYRGVDGLLGRVAHLMTSSAKERLIYELILEAKRFGEADASGIYILNINEKDLGARAGLTRETVSREVNKLKAEDLITVQSKTIKICDLKVLEAKLSRSN